MTRLFSKKVLGGGFMDVIRCDEPSYLIWKWHPEGSERGKNRKENAIRFGSSLRVKDGSAAVFVYPQYDGTVQDFIVGPYDGILETQNLPILSNIVGLAYAGGSPFQAEVYFINLAEIITIKFAVPYFEIFDSRFLDFGVPTAVRGTIGFMISDCEEFIRLHRLDNFSVEDFEKQIRDTVIRCVKGVVANVSTEYSIPIVQIEKKIDFINELVEAKIQSRLQEKYGVTVSFVDIGAIDVDKTSDGYRQLKSVTQDLTAARTRAETEDYVERLRIQREEGQYAMHKQTQSANISAFQTEQQAEAGIAGAEALGYMGKNGAGGINPGGNDVGFNPAAMMAGMVLGEAVGQNLVGAMNGAMSGTNAHSHVTPPPIPASVYNVAVDGKPTGPYDTATLKQMAQSGSIGASTLLWTPGMRTWAKLADISELAEVLNAIPPMIQ